jgi:hypothetical protein
MARHVMETPNNQSIFFTMMNHYLTIFTKHKKGNEWTKYLGPNSLRCTKILSQHHIFLSFVPSHFYHIKTHLWMIVMKSIIIMI